MKRLCLVGMPNCGKSTLFNRLTGAHAHTGNRAGVTVLAEEGRMRLDGETVAVVDLPGIRSLSPVSPDECETLRVLTEEPTDAMLFVCDATDLASAVPLLQGIQALLSERDVPIPCGLVLNCCDELARFPNPQALNEACEDLAVAVSARNGRGMGTLRSLISRLLGGTREGDSPFPAECCRRVLAVLGETSGRVTARSERLDRLFLHPVIGVMLFLAVMGCVLFVAFGTVGEWLTAWFRSALTVPLSSLLSKLLFAAPEWLRALILDGVVGGVGAVLDFLPRLGLLFWMQALLEESGILARFNRLFDRPMSTLGLRGDAMTAILLGFGCTVPAILCTRAMKNRDCAARCSCAMPAVVCSARIPLCLVVAEAFFGTHGWWVTGLVWLLSALCFLLLCGLYTLFSSHRERIDAHTDALPRWRLPTLRASLSAMGKELSHFLRRAGGLILLSSVLIWVLANLSPSGRFVERDGIGEGILAHLGRLISPLLAPIGLDDWRLCAALLSGLAAKEASLSTLCVLVGGTADTLPAMLAASGILTPASALSFLVFYCLYFPCAATVATLKTEKRPLRSLTVFPILAYCMAFLIRWIGSI